MWNSSRFSKARQGNYSLVGIVTSLWAGQLGNHSSVPGRSKKFSLLHSLQPIQPPTEWVFRALFLWVKKLEHEADHSPLSSAKVKNEWSCISTLPSALKAYQTSPQERKHRLGEPTKILGSKHDVITKTNTHTQIKSE